MSFLFVFVKDNCILEFYFPMAIMFMLILFVKSLSFSFDYYVFFNNSSQLIESECLNTIK